MAAFGGGGGDGGNLGQSSTSLLATSTNAVIKTSGSETARDVVEVLVDAEIRRPCARFVRKNLPQVVRRLLATMRDRSGAVLRQCEASIDLVPSVRGEYLLRSSVMESVRGLAHVPVMRSGGFLMRKQLLLARFAADLSAVGGASSSRPGWARSCRRSTNSADGRCSTAPTRYALHIFEPHPIKTPMIISKCGHL